MNYALVPLGTTVMGPEGRLITRVRPGSGFGAFQYADNGPRRTGGPGDTTPSGAALIPAGGFGFSPAQVMAVQGPEARASYAAMLADVARQNPGDAQALANAQLAEMILRQGGGAGLLGGSIGLPGVGCGGSQGCGIGVPPASAAGLTQGTGGGLGGPGMAIVRRIGEGTTVYAGLQAYGGFHTIIEGEFTVDGAGLWGTDNPTPGINIKAGRDGWVMLWSITSNGSNYDKTFVTSLSLNSDPYAIDVGSKVTANDISFRSNYRFLPPPARVYPGVLFNITGKGVAADVITFEGVGWKPEKFAQLVREDAPFQQYCRDMGLINANGLPVPGC